MHEDDTPPDFSRRSIITSASLVPLAAIGVAAAATESVLSPPQLRVIEAFVDRLIPTDENGPGARDCGVPTYIDRSLAGYLTAERSAFTAGLAATDALARERHGAAFADLDAAKRDALLTAMENNEAAGFTPDSRTFFYRVRQLTLEGMFGDPFYGGNRGFAGWDLIRYPGPRMAVSADDQKLKDPIKPLRASAHGGRHGR
jgi:gluconate 2-dehydrogenase gamma chain